VIIKMMVSIGDLQFNVGSEPQWRSGIFHFPKVSLTDMKSSVCEQKNPHTNLLKTLWIKA
jgi:hypothetical protein